MARFDKFDAQRKAATTMNSHVPTNECKEESPLSSESATKPSSSSSKKHEQEIDDDELSDVKDSPPPKKKKRVEYESDAAFAAKLQAQENARIRSTRGGGSRPTPVKKKKSPKKKTSAKVKAEDDSDMDGSASDVKEKKVKRTGGFHVSFANISFGAYCHADPCRKN